jgi:hypothetical protein
LGIATPQEQIPSVPQDAKWWNLQAILPPQCSKYTVMARAKASIKQFIFSKSINKSKMAALNRMYKETPKPRVTFLRHLRKVTGCSLNTASRWVSGDALPGPENMAKLVSHFKMSAEKLFDKPGVYEND